MGHIARSEPLPRRPATGIAARLWGGVPPSPPIALAGVAVALAMAVPLFYILWRGATGGTATWTRLWNVRLPELLWNTLLLTGAVTVLTAVIGVLLAWLIERTDLPGRRALRWLAALPLAVPPYVGALVYSGLLAPKGTLDGALSLPLPPFYGFGGTALVLTLFTYPYVYLSVAAALRGMNASLEEAALAAGRSRLTVFRRVILPLLRPAIGAGALLVALYVLADFGTVTLLRYDTFSSAIYEQLRGRFDRAGASVLSLILVGLTLALLTLEGRWRGGRRYEQTAAGRRAPKRLGLGRWRGPATVAAWTVVGLALIVPVAMLGWWAQAGLRDDSLAARIWRTSSGGLLDYAWHSLWLSVLGASLAVALALPLAYLSARHAGPLTSGLARLAQSGYALPGVVVGLSLVFLFNRYLPWFYGTTAVVLAAYALRFYSQAYQTITAALAQVSPALEEAARGLGRTPARAMLAVTLPLIRPGLVAAWALVYLSCLKELPATLLLRPAGYDTLPVRIWIQTGEGVTELAAPAALLLVLLAAPPLILLLRRDAAVG